MRLRQQISREVGDTAAGLKPISRGGLEPSVIRADSPVLDDPIDQMIARRRCGLRLSFSGRRDGGSLSRQSCIQGCLCLSQRRFSRGDSRMTALDVTRVRRTHRDLLGMGSSKVRLSRHDVSAICINSSNGFDRHGGNSNTTRRQLSPQRLTPGLEARLDACSWCRHRRSRFRAWKCDPGGGLNSNSSVVRRRRRTGCDTTDGSTVSFKLEVTYA